jgi:hypothetical protein
VVAVVDPASRHATASVAAVQQAVSTHPVSASGIRLSSRPVSGHLGWSSRGSSARPSAVHPSSPLLSSRAVSSRLVSSRRSGLVPGSWSPAHRHLVPTPPPEHGRRRTGGGPGGCRAVDGSIDGRGGRDAGDAADIALAGGRSVADRAAGWGAGCGGRVWPLSDQAGQAAMGSGRLRCGHGCRLQRADSCTGRMAGVLGWVCDHGGWSSPRLTPGWADPEGPGRGRRGWACGPSAAQAGSERSRLAIDSALSCDDGWWACQDLNLGPHPDPKINGERARGSSGRSPDPIGVAPVAR